MHNAGAYWDAHEAWETLWKNEPRGRARAAIQGLIQVTAAMHKLVNALQPESAQRLLAKGLSKLAPPPADVLGRDVENFRRDALRFERELAAGTVGEIPQLVLASRPPAPDSDDERARELTSGFSGEFTEASTGGDEGRGR